MITFLYVLYVMVCLFLILVVLLQAGRGGMGAAFGGSSQTVFGGSGAGNFLTRLTVISAALFMMLSATLTYVSTEAEYTPPIIYSNETRAKLVFLVEARPAVDAAPRLRPGQPVTVTLQ